MVQQRPALLYTADQTSVQDNKGYIVCGVDVGARGQERLEDISATVVPGLDQGRSVVLDKADKTRRRAHSRPRHSKERLCLLLCVCVHVHASARVTVGRASIATQTRETKEARYKRNEKRHEALQGSSVLPPLPPRTYPAAAFRLHVCALHQELLDTLRLPSFAALYNCSPDMAGRAERARGEDR
eukprot:g36706.t1